jgi:hypothetical protein
VLICEGKTYEKGKTMKAGMFAVFTISLLITASPSLFAQRDYDDDYGSGRNIFQEKDMYAVGLQAGLMTGTGVAVRFHPMGRWGFQVVGGGMAGNVTSAYSFGAEVQFDFEADRRARFYCYAGGGFYAFKKHGDDKLESPSRFGVGIAYEWGVSRKLVFNVSGALTYFENGNFFPTPQIGMHYYFQ